MFDSKNYHRIYNRERYHKKRQVLFSEFGDACVSCGSRENLEFDHIDPSVKTIPAGDVLRFSIQRIKTELRKCQVLCRNCHIKKSRQDKSHPNIKLTDSDVLKIRSLYASGQFTQKQIAAMYDVSQRHVSDICSKKRWSDVK